MLAEEEIQQRGGLGGSSAGKNQGLLKRERPGRGAFGQGSDQVCEA